MSFKKKILSILFWSVISAAFIGPGTVTTATKAGATFEFDLLWALVFSTAACVLLQEASARITIISGKNLGQAIGKQFENSSSKKSVLILVIGAIIIGCAAYEAGNFIGAISGLVLMFDNVSPKLLVLIMGVLVFLTLNLPSITYIANFMGILVFSMGVAFFTTAIQLNPPIEAILEGSFIPKIPDGDGAGLLILGLIGTTVVPYDIFLGSGVIEGKTQKISEMRFGISVAIILGGIISMSILAVGTAIETEYSFEALADTLTSEIGAWAVYIFGFGMFAAGFSSAITAPLASAITAKSLFQSSSTDSKWSTQSTYFKTVWFVVLLTGIIFGLADVKPIPAIILAQALNGFILPFISIFLIIVINNRGVMGDKNINGWFSNILMTIVVWVTLILGFINLVQAFVSIFNIPLPESELYYTIIITVAFIISMFVLAKVIQIRKTTTEKVLEKTPEV